MLASSCIVLLVQAALQSSHSGQAGWLRVASALLECLAALALAAANDARNRLRLINLLFPAQSVAQSGDRSPLYTIVLAVCEEAAAAANPTSGSISEQPKSSPHNSLTNGQTTSAVVALMDAAEALAALAAKSCHRGGTDGDVATGEIQRDSLHTILGALVAPPGGLLLEAVQPDASLGSTFSAAVRLKALTTTAAIFKDTGMAPSARVGVWTVCNGSAMASSPPLGSCRQRDYAGNRFIATHHTTHHVHLHFMLFLKAYNAPLASERLSSMQAACGHLQVHLVYPGPRWAPCPPGSPLGPLCAWIHTVQHREL